MEKQINECILSPKDYESTQEVKWCPGCGDYAIINAMKKALSELGLQKENTAFISGIGCSSRFPYYMDTYGFHTIHGRPLAIATGTKIANPNLDVFVISGDGDALAIGGNHFIHAIRRNVNLNLIVFNNQIYGLTKGQYSPTSEIGSKTKSSPHGTIEHPFSVGELALGAKTGFYARVVDTDIKMMVEVIKKAYNYNGLSVIEVLQNCVIFNDKVHDLITNKETKLNNQLYLKHNEPMLFGENNDMGLILDGLNLKVVKIGEEGITENNVLKHDATSKSNILHQMLVQMKLPDFPIALGVIRNCASEESYDDKLHHQIATEKQKSSFKSLNELFFHGNTFKV